MYPSVLLLDRVPPRFSIESAEEWFRARWYLAVYASVVYLVLIWVGKWWMLERPKYSLQHVLVAWNTGLAVFSALGAAELFPELLSSLSKGGVVEWVCHNEVFTTPRKAMWVFLFVLFKMPELGDTAFVVLRKQPLNFLHYYHHVTVLLYTWYCYSLRVPCSATFVLLNFIVHAAMYLYYAVKASGRRLPVWVSQCLTVMQLLQFFAAVLTLLLAFWLSSHGKPCGLNYTGFYLGMGMYFSYFVLFMNFFVQRYIFRR